jgi:hypothetical protein
MDSRDNGEMNVEEKLIGVRSDGAQGKAYKMENVTMVVMPHLSARATVPRGMVGISVILATCCMLNAYRTYGPAPRRVPDDLTSCMNPEHVGFRGKHVISSATNKGVSGRCGR